MNASGNEECVECGEVVADWTLCGTCQRGPMHREECLDEHWKAVHSGEGPAAVESPEANT